MPNDDAYDTPLKGTRKSSGEPTNGNIKWIEKELDRLNESKVDKAFHKPEMKRVDEKFGDITRKIRELREEMDKDITGIQDVADSANDKAGQHLCIQEERLKIVEKLQEYWSTWFLKGLVGLVMLLISGGGTLLYSHYHLTETTRQTAIAVQESRKEVDSIRDAQEIQRKTLQRIEYAGTRLDTTKVEEVLRQALQSVLSESAH